LLSWLRKLSRSADRADAQRAAALARQAEEAGRAGNPGEAARLLIAAIEAQPGAAALHYELGCAMRALNEPARAVTCYRQALALDPALTEAHIDLASTLLALGNAEAAERCARDALALDARSLTAQVNLGAALEGQGRFHEAADAFRRALEIDAASMPALVNLGAVSLRLGRLDEAERSLARAVELAPAGVEARLRLGHVLLERRQPERAADCYREALRLEPGLVAGHVSLGHSLDLQGRFDQAMACYERALAIDPDNVQAHLNRSALWLLEGDFARGWDEYEWRLRDPGQAPLHLRFPQPRWDGAPLAGRRLLVYGEQGLGDQIMAASCLPEVIAQAAHCVLDCDARLAPLFRRSFPQATVHGGGPTDPVDWLREAGPVDVAVPLASLPRHLRRAAAAFPRHAGFLHAAPERVAAWRERLASLGEGRRIGISWRGGVPQTNRGARSLPLADLLPLLRGPGARFVSLQYGPAEEELDALRREHGVDIAHWPEAIDDYDETAALVAALDLTVSVCTAVVHLAGALGRPAWVLAPVRPEPRYGKSGDTMPWYPSVRVFRQPRYGEWAPVIASAAAALAAANLRTGP
jgi:tetratricopeptide (TPR) repeat protein